MHAGLSPEQLPSVVHSTHVFAGSLHTGLVPLQTGLHADVLPPVPLLPPVARWHRPRRHCRRYCQRHCSITCRRSRSWRRTLRCVCSRRRCGSTPGSPSRKAKVRPRQYCLNREIPCAGSLPRAARLVSREDCRLRLSTACFEVTAVQRGDEDPSHRSGRGYRPREAARVRPSSMGEAETSPRLVLRWSAVTKSSRDPSTSGSRTSPGRASFHRKKPPNRIATLPWSALQELAPSRGEDTSLLATRQNGRNRLHL